MYIEGDEQEMTEKTLEMEAVELIAKARKEGEIVDFGAYKNRLRYAINDTSISIGQMDYIEEQAKCEHIPKPLLKDIVETLRLNIIATLEKDRLL